MKEVIYIRIERKIKEELDNMALNENRSLNNFICTILMKYIEENKNGAK